MFSSFSRMTSYFENSDSKAVGKPSPEELKLLEPFRGQVPDEVFGEPYLPPVSDGSGSDRALLRRADEMLRAAGCKREGNVLKLPNGQPFEIEFLDSQGALQPHTQPFQANLKRLGITATSRIVDGAQYQRRLDEFDFDIISRALGGSAIPSDCLRIVYGSEAAKTRGSRNVGGIASPAIDAMIETIGQADSYAEVVVAAKCLDRLLRAGRYWIPMWWNASEWLAYWDMFDRPADQAEIFGSGAPGNLVVRCREGEADREGVSMTWRSARPALPTHFSVIARSDCDEATQGRGQHSRAGLLRCARNDGGR